MSCRRATAGEAGGLWHSRSKTARNERRKLFATFLNNVAVAWFIAGLLQPILALAREGETLGSREFGVGFVLMLTSAIFGMAAQALEARVGSNMVAWLIIAMYVVAGLALPLIGAELIDRDMRRSKEAEQRPAE